MQDGDNPTVEDTESSKPLAEEPSEPQEEGSEPQEEGSEPPQTSHASPDDDFGDDEPPLEGMPVEAPPLDRPLLLFRLESLIFASSEPIGVRRLAAILNLDGKTIRSLLKELSAQYENRGIILEEISKGFQFRSHPDNAPILRDVFNLKPLKISKAALEALAIVAYRQPITRAEAEQIRGVDCGGVLKYLFEKNLVRVIGRKEEAGRPIIYGTTKTFLELFGLKSLSDLPALHEFSELWEENQKLVDTETPLDPSAAPGPSLPGFQPATEAPAEPLPPEPEKTASDEDDSDTQDAAVSDAQEKEVSSDESAEEEALTEDIPAPEEENVSDTPETADVPDGEEEND
jgi:segregation and condensation protein B